MAARSSERPHPRLEAFKGEVERETECGYYIDTSWSSTTTYTFVLAECPLPWCDVEFETGGNVAHHLEQDHTPEDFGLSPMKDD